MTHSTVPIGITHHRHRTGVAVFAAIIAFSAYAGAIGLVSGGLSLGEFTARLPFGSPVLGGIALALIVAVPSTWLAWLSRRRSRRRSWFRHSGQTDEKSHTRRSALLTMSS